MGAGQSKPGEPGAEDPNEPQLPGGGGRPPTVPTPESESESSTSTTETTTTESSTTTETTTSTTTSTTTTTISTPTPTPTPTSLSHATLPTSSPLQTQAKGGGKVNLAAIVLPCLFAPFIIAAIAIFVIRRQRKKANARLLEDFKRRSMFGTRGNDLFSTAKHEVQAPPPSSSPAPFKPQPPSAYSDAYSARSPYGTPSAYSTAPGATSPAYPGYTAPPAWGAAPAWQAAAPPAESSAAWSALGVAAPPSAPSPVSPSPVSPYEIDDRRQLRVTNARSISEQSISSVGHDAPLIPASPGGAKKDDELVDETLKAWMKD